MSGALLSRRRAPKRVIVTASLRGALGLVLLVVIYFTAPLNGKLGALPLALLVVALAAFGLLVFVQVKGVLRADYPLVRALEGVAWTVPGFLVIFSSVYYAMSLQNHAAFSSQLSKLDSLYFTVTTFATVGFGDITPVSQAARAIAIIQMLIDLVVIGVIVKTLARTVQAKLEKNQD